MSYVNGKDNANNLGFNGREQGIIVGSELGNPTVIQGEEVELISPPEKSRIYYLLLHW